MAQQHRIYACCAFACLLFANKRYRRIIYHSKKGTFIKTLTLSMFHTPALPDSSPHPTSEIGLNKMASNVTMQEEEDEEKVWDSDPYRLIDEHLDGDIFLSPSQEYHSYPYHLFLSIMLALFFRRRPYHGSLFLSLHFKEWRRWLIKYAMHLPFGIRCYYAFTKSIPSFTFYLNDCLRSKLNPDETFLVSPMSGPDEDSFFKTMNFIDMKICPTSSVYKIGPIETLEHMFHYKRKVFEQIYDPEMKSLVMPKLYPSVSPYSIFGNTRFSRERYMFYEPLIRDLTFPQSKSFSEPPNLASTKLLNPKPPTPRPGQKPAEVSPEALLQSVLYTSSILYFEMMECYATLVFRLMERAQLFDLIHYTEQKNSVFSSILSSVDIWKDNMLMDVPFHLIISWYLKVNDIDLRFVNKYISRHCLNIKSQIYKRPRSYEIYIHPKVKRAEKKFVEIDHPVFTNYLKAAKMFFPKDRYRGARRKGFHCYFIGAGNTLKNKRFKNNILSKRFWKRRRKLRYNCLLQKLMIKKLYSAKPYHRFRDFFRDTSSKSDILRNYSFFYKYFNDLDNYIGFSDIGLMKCPHARSEEKCYKASKYVADTILKTFFNLIDKCSRIKKWLLKRFVPELENFFEMMLEIVKIASCKNIAYKIGRRHENWMKSAPYRESIIQEKLSSSEDISSSDSSMFGKLHRSFSHVHKRYKEEDHEKRETWQESNLESNQPKKINKNKYSSFPSMVLLRLMNIIPILNNDFIFSDLSAFGNTFVDRYTRETSDIQGVDFIKYRLPTEIRRVVTTANEDSSEILKPAKISRGLSRIIAGKDRTYEKYISLIKPPLKEMMAKANNPTVVANDGRKAVSETVITSHFMDTKSVDENGHSFPSPDQLKAPRSYPNLLDGPSVRLSDAPTNRSQPFTPFTLNPIVIYLMSLFSSKMFNKYKELCFLQNYLIIGKPLGRYFQKIKKSESIQIYKSRMSVIKSVRSSQQIKLSVSYKEKKSVKKLPDKWLKRNRDVRYLLSCQVGYLSGLLKSVVDRELAKAGLYDSDESSVSSPCSDSVESLDSVSTGYLPPDLYKMFGVIKTKDEYKYTSQSDAWSTSSSSSTHQQHRVPPSSALPNVSRKSVSSVGTSTPTRKVPLTMDNVTFFRMAMYAILNSLRAHILDLSNYPVEKLFPCLGDLRIPTVTQLMLELYTWSIPDFKSDSDSDESYDDPSEAQEALETSDNTLLYDDSDNANNIDIEPSGSVLNIKMKSYSELNPISDLRASESLDEIAEIQNNKYDIFHRVISEPSYCLLPPDFIDSFLGIIEEGARKGGILNPLFINRAYYEALERYSRQIEHLPYHRPTIPQLSHPNNIKQSQTKRQKEVNFLDFFLDLANTFVDILYSCKNCSQFYHFFIRYLSCKICDRLQGPYGYASSHVVHCHRRAIKSIIETSIIPIGDLRIGSHLEKAMLFKYLADYFMIPCQLYRAGNLLTWVEVPAHPHHRLEDNYYLVDLFQQPGHIYKKDVKKIKQLFGYQDRTVDDDDEYNIARDIEIWLEDAEEKEINSYKKTPKYEKTNSEILQHRRYKSYKSNIRSQIKRHLRSIFNSRIECLEKYKNYILDAHKKDRHKIDFSASNLVHDEFVKNVDKQVNELLESITKSKDVQEIINNILAAFFDKEKDIRIDISIIKKLFAKNKCNVKTHQPNNEKKEPEEEVSCLDLDLISNVSDWSIDERRKKKNKSPPLVPQPQPIEKVLPFDPSPPQLLPCKRRKKKIIKNKKHSMTYIRKKIGMISQNIKRNKAHFFLKYTGNYRQFPMDHCLVKKAKEKTAWGVSKLLDESSSEVGSYSSQERLLYQWNKVHLPFFRSQKKKKIAMKKCTSNVLKNVPPLYDFYKQALKEPRAVLLIVVKEISKNFAPEEKEMANKGSQTKKDTYYFDDDIYDNFELNQSSIVDDNDETNEAEISSQEEEYSDKSEIKKSRSYMASLTKKMITYLTPKKVVSEESELIGRIIQPPMNEKGSFEKTLATLEMDTEELEITPADYVTLFPGVIVVRAGKMSFPVNKSVQTTDPYRISFKQKTAERILNEQFKEKIKKVLEDNISDSIPYDIELKEIKDIPKDFTTSQLYLLDISSIESSSEESRIIKISKFAKHHLGNYIAQTEPPDFTPSRRGYKVKLHPDHSWPRCDDVYADMYADVSSSDSEMIAPPEETTPSEDTESLLQEYFQLEPKDHTKVNKPQNIPSEKSYTIKSNESEVKSYISKWGKGVSGGTHHPPAKKMNVQEWLKLRKKLVYDIFYTFDPRLINLSQLFYQINHYFDKNNISMSQWMIEEELEEI